MIYLIISIAIIFIVLHIILAIFLSKKIKITSHKSSEKTVSLFFENLLKDEQYKIFDNIIIPGTGKYKDFTTEIDTLIVCKRGIFVIETKSWKGKIRGDRESKEWKIIYDNDEVHYNPNPIIQNKNHVNFVYFLLKEKHLNLDKIPIYSYVVFYKGNIRSIDCSECFNLGEKLAYDFLSKEKRLSDEYYKLITNYLEYYQNSEELKEKHKKFIENRKKRFF